MKRTVLLGIAILFISTLASAGWTAESEKQDGRYALYIVTNDNKQVPYLLDTRTGKIWQYTEEQGVSTGVPSSAAKPKFKGVTVENLVFGLKDSGDLEKQIELLHANDFVNKDLKGFRELMASEFSYALDIDKAQGIYEKLKSSQPKK